MLVDSNHDEKLYEVGKSQPLASDSSNSQKTRKIKGPNCIKSKKDQRNSAQSKTLNLKNSPKARRAKGAKD